MKKRRLLMLFYVIGAGCLFMLARAPLSPVLQGVIAAPAFAQGHSGHSAQPPAQTPAKEKTEAVKQPPGKQEATPEQAVDETPQVEISPEQQRLIGVKTVKVQTKPLQKVIRTVGRVEADERKLATVNTKIEGWIEKLYVDYTGRYVKKGEPLAEIYSPELLATQQEFISILKWAGRQTGATLGTGRLEKARRGHPVLEWSGLRNRNILNDKTFVRAKKSSAHDRTRTALLPNYSALSPPPQT